MTASVTEAAMLALKAVLDASPALPTVRRDPVFPETLEEFTLGGDKYGRALTMMEGLRHQDKDGNIPYMNGCFEIVHNVEIQWFFSGKEGAVLHQEFDAGRTAIYQAVESDRMLGGAVSGSEIMAAPIPSNESVASKVVLSTLIFVRLTYISPRTI